MTESQRAQRISELKFLREQKLAELNKERELIEGTEILSRLLNIDKENLVWKHDEENSKIARQLHVYHKRLFWETSPGYTHCIPPFVEKVKEILKIDTDQIHISIRVFHKYSSWFNLNRTTFFEFLTRALDQSGLIYFILKVNSDNFLFVYDAHHDFEISTLEKNTQFADDTWPLISLLNICRDSLKWHYYEKNLELANSIKLHGSKIFSATPPTKPFMFDFLKQVKNLIKLDGDDELFYMSLQVISGNYSSWFNFYTPAFVHLLWSFISQSEMTYFLLKTKNDYLLFSYLGKTLEIHTIAT